jgi:hypothetical protein
MTRASPDITAVVFRRWRDTGDIFALFPEIAVTADTALCGSYAHVGQHGVADYRLAIGLSRPCSLADASPLWQELQDRGYVLRPIQRATRQHHARRQATVAWREIVEGRNDL